MDCRTPIRLLALWVAVAWTADCHAQAAERKPNIIHIVADELGYYEMSCLGNPHLQTPNLDRMAAEGVRFTQALAGSALCAPTRACLMTGKHSGHTSVRSNGGGTPLRAGEATIASVLKQAGYATGGFGKWGCGGRGSTGVPEKHGFDLFVGYYDQVHAHTYYPAYLVRNSEELPLLGNQGGRSGQTYAHYVIVAEAMKFIRTNQGRPFYCYLPVTPPHGWFDIPDTDPAWALFKDRDWPEEAKRYTAMVNMVSDLQMTAFAEKAHTPVQEGTFQTTALHQKDRQAKFGQTAPAPARGEMAAARLESLPAEGLIPHANWRIVRASSESIANDVRWRVLSGVNAGPWASVAELGVIGK